MADNITLDLPKPRTSELLQILPKEQITTTSSDFYDTLNKGNQYLWFAFGVIALGIVVYAWINLITAKWDEKAMKKITSTLVGLILWLFIAIFSSLIIKLVINLLD